MSVKVTVTGDREIFVENPDAGASLSTTFGMFTIRKRGDFAIMLRTNHLNNEALELINRFINGVATTREVEVLRMISNLSWYPAHDALNKYAKDPSDENFKKIQRRVKLANAAHRRIELAQRFLDSRETVRIVEGKNTTIVIMKLDYYRVHFLVRRGGTYRAYMTDRGNKLIIGNALNGKIRTVSEYLIEVPLHEMITVMNKMVGGSQQDIDALIEDLKSYIVAERLAEEEA
ncbi:MAG: hypothetical protein ACP5LG_06585 [Conexivisphaera sp.]